MMTTPARLSRRSFIGSTLGASAGAALAGPLAIVSRAAGRVAASERITMALIGCGGMGNANLRGFLSMDDVQVLAVCDPDASRRASTREAVQQRYAEATRDGTYRVF
jgi:threonine dehydrogenase-like Zn-dependent dehydrogenase